MKSAFSYFMILLMSSFMTGCIGSEGGYHGPKLNVVYDHLVDYAWVHESRHKGVNEVGYYFKGVEGPRSIHLANSAGARAVIELDLLKFPSEEDSMLSVEELESIKRESITYIKNYFGTQREVSLYVLKREEERVMKYYSLDLRHPEKDITLADYLVTRGLVLVNAEVAELSGMTYLLGVQKEAEKQEVGLWKIDHK